MEQKAEIIRLRLLVLILAGMLDAIINFQCNRTGRLKSIKTQMPFSMSLYLAINGVMTSLTHQVTLAKWDTKPLSHSGQIVVEAIFPN